jgi:AsmA protein
MALTMAQGMKRLGTPIAALLALVLVAMIASSWLINRDALRDAVEAQIRAVTGLDLTVNGAIDISVFPGSYVSFHDVGLKGGTDAPALRVDVLTANLRLLPLLLQRFEIADVMMLRPQIRVVRDANGDSNWTITPRRSWRISTSRWPGPRSRAPLPRPGNSTGAASASTARSTSPTFSPRCRATAPG